MKILFVCIGNTCRSPMAESVMDHWANKNNLQWQTDSAALRTWNIGRSPEGRCLKILAQNNLKSRHIGRVITEEDFSEFDYIFGMDESNMRELQELAQQVGDKCTAKIELLGSYIGRKEDEIISDPYFTNGMGGFHCAYAQINESCQNFVQKQIANNANN